MVNEDVAPKNDADLDEEWVPETHYSARIGGIIFRNVKKSLVVNEEVPIKFSRNINTGQLGISFLLRTEAGTPIATVQYNRISDLDDAYACLHGEWGGSVIEKSTGRVWCDVRTSPIDRECELDCSCLLIGTDGYPVFLHPDRAVFGRPHEDSAPNIAGATLAGDLSMDQTAIHFDAGGFYLIDLAIVDFATGIKVSYGLKQDVV
jgi:hypothetical protein